MRSSKALLILLLMPLPLVAQPLGGEHPLNIWVKRSPLKEAPVSPGLSYETSIAYDPLARRIIRWGGHAQGGVKGSGEQIAELWTLDPATMKWELKEPNRSPPAVCCAQQNVFDTVQNRFLRFKSFSGNHGWQWFREIYLNNSSVWNYDLASNTWRDRRPLPEPVIGALHGASWDPVHQIAVVFGGEGTQEGTHVYDAYTNTWTRRLPMPAPPPRSGGNMAYDSFAKRHLLFGSQFTDDPHTWAYNPHANKEGTWTELKPATMPPTDRNDALLAFDSVNRKTLAVVRAGAVADKKEVVNGRLETWVYDSAENTWKAMKPTREPDGFGGRSRVMTYVPHLNLFVLEAYINPAQRVAGVEREQQIWTYRIADGKPAANLVPKARTQPRIVEDAVVSVLSAREVAVTWPESPDKKTAGYHVERAVVEVFSEDEIHRLKKDTPPLDPPSLGAIKAIGTFQRLTRTPLKVNHFTDTTIDLTRVQTLAGKPMFQHRFQASQLDSKGKPYRYAVYAYRLRVVNEAGEESGPSPYFLTIPSAPQHHFAREEGDKCHLKWAANPEQGIKGYRIYWMKGPRPEGPGQATHRLTSTPIAETRFTDADAGAEVRRYWVVAVDALGQEGIPSSPAWHYRTCRHFYVPFVGEWHQ